MATFEYLNLAGLTKYHGLIKANFVAKETGKGLSEANFTAAEKTKLEGVAAGAQVNVIESVKVNGTALEVSDKAVNVVIPTAVSAFTNDAGYLVAADIANKVDNTITVNGQALSANVVLDYEDVGAVPTTRTINGKALSADVTLAPSDIGAAEAVHVHDVATSTVNGFMSAADKAKLDGIAEGANKYELPAATASELGGVTVGDNITLNAGNISLVKANVTNALGYTPLTEAEINTAISTAVANAGHLKREIVAALPTENIDADTIYMMLVSEGTVAGNVYDEYMFINDAWEKLGSTAADLSAYAKTADFGTISDESIEALFA